MYKILNDSFLGNASSILGFIFSIFIACYSYRIKRILNAVKLKERLFYEYDDLSSKLSFLQDKLINFSNLEPALQSNLLLEVETFIRNYLFIYKGLSFSNNLTAKWILLIIKGFKNTEGQLHSLKNKFTNFSSNIRKEYLNGNTHIK